MARNGTPEHMPTPPSGGWHRALLFHVRHYARKERGSQRLLADTPAHSRLQGAQSSVPNGKLMPSKFLLQRLSDRRMGGH